MGEWAIFLNTFASLLLTLTHVGLFLSCKPSFTLHILLQPCFLSILNLFQLLHPLLHPLDVLHLVLDCLLCLQVELLYLLVQVLILVMFLSETGEDLVNVLLDYLRVNVTYF